jgi:folate-binding protein YgfZ
MTDRLVAARIARDVLRLRGTDTWTFLQGQLSQDVDALGEGESAWSFLLHPDGKVAAWLRVTRLAPDEALLDVDAGHGEAVTARLDRFKLRVDCTIEALDWETVAVRGPGAADVPAAGAGLALPAHWPGAEAVDLLGPEVPDPAGVTMIELDRYEALRVEAGVPAMGSELTDRTIPAESGVVERSVSFTKGCFTGQELVARIESRGGNVPRHLRSIVGTGGPLPAPGTPLEIAGEEVGTLTSVAGSVGLGYVKRSVEPPAEGEAVAGDERSPVSITALPT